MESENLFSVLDRKIIIDVDLSSEDSIIDANFNTSNCTAPSLDSENEAVSVVTNSFVGL